MRVELVWAGQAVADQVEAAFEIGGAVRRLDGSRMRTAEELWAEFARRLDFPPYFGHNWAALEDCLTDLDWLRAPSYLIVIDSADQILAEEQDPLVGLFGDLLVRACRHWALPIEDGEWWDRPGIDFQVLLHASSAEAADRLRSRWTAAGVELVVP